MTPAPLTGIPVGPPRKERTPTRRQVDILAFIREWYLRFGYAPTHREMMGRFGMRSTNSAATHMRALERLGLIHRDPLLSRGTVITAKGERIVGRAHQAATKPPRAAPIVTVRRPLVCEGCGITTFRAGRPCWKCGSEELRVA